MPEAVAAVVVTIGLEVNSAVLITYASTIGSTLFYTAAIAASYGYQQHQRAKARASYNASLTDRLVMRKTATGVRSRCYGRVRNVDAVLFDQSRGTHKKYRTLVVALAGHEIGSIETIWLNDTAVELSPDGWVMSEPWAQYTAGQDFVDMAVDADAESIAAPGDYAGDGDFVVRVPVGEFGYETYPTSVVDGRIITTAGLGTAGRWVLGDYTSVTSYVRVRQYLGAPDQDISPELHELFPDLIVEGRHQFAGIALLLVDLEVGREDSRLQQVPNISATITGAAVLDPRDDTTAYTGNMALIANDWIYHPNGGGMPAGIVQAGEVEAAADSCDRLYIPDGYISAQTIYWGGIVCPTDQDPWGMLQEMAEAMAGDVGWAGGQIRLLAGEWRAPVMEITDAHLSGVDAIDLAPQQTIDQVYNTLVVRYADDSDNTFQERTVTVRHDDAITEDGTELSRTMDMRAVNHTARVEYIAQALLNDARAERTITLPLTHACLPLQRFDTVYITLDRYSMDMWEAKLVATSWSRDGGRIGTFKETSAAIWPEL